MRKVYLWVVAGCLMALSLVLVSCSQSTSATTQSPATQSTSQPAQTTTSPTTSTSTTSTPTATSTPTQQVQQAAPAASNSEKPQYGGMIVQATDQRGDPGGRFDPGTWMMVLEPTIYVTTDKLLQGDWTKGPAGTGETDWHSYLGNNFDQMTGSIAQSWDLPNPTTIIWHIRHGVHFWNKAPVNGREFTAQDAVWNIDRQWFTKEPVFNTSAWPPGNAPISVNATDRYTVTMTMPAAAQGMQILATGSQVYMIAPEVVQQYGDANNWQHYVATGPFEMTDYVQNSYMSFKRNPDYWQTNPIGAGKGDQLPYADGISWIIISDTSTREAAFRTGKIDYYQGLTWDDYSTLSKEVPASVQHEQVYGLVYNPVGRMDKTDLPFQSLLVRQALNLAVDQKSILDNYYEGHGELLSWPFYSGKDWSQGYIPMQDLPQAAQDMFSYDPAKAKQLLAQAGYPNGFKTTIVTEKDQVDLLSIVKAQLAQVGVDMTIDEVTPDVYNMLDRKRSFDQMIMKGTKEYFIPWQMNTLRVDNFDDDAYFSDPKITAAYNELLPYVGKDPAKVWQILKGITPYMIEQAPMGIYMPVPYNYDVWWPWLKNFFDATSIGDWDPGGNLKYAWIDQPLKKSMGY